MPKAPRGPRLERALIQHFERAGMETRAARASAKLARRKAREDRNKIPYVRESLLLPMGRAARMNAAQRAREFSYPLPADASPKVKHHVQGREILTRLFLHQQLINPTMTRALFNSYYSGLRKTITAELQARGYALKGPQYNRYDPTRKKVWGESTLHKYAKPGEPTGRSELYWHSRGHLLIGKAIFADPINFKLEEVYPKVLAELEAERKALAEVRKKSRKASSGI